MFEFLNDHFRLARYPVYAQNLILLAIPLLAGLLLRYVLAALAHRKARQTGNYSFFRSAIKHLSKPLTLWLPLLFVRIALEVMTLPGKWEQRLDKILDIALILSFAWILMSLLQVARDYTIHRYDVTKQDNINERRIRTQLQVVHRIVSGTIIFVAIAFVLLSFEGVRKIGAGLLTGVGIGGIIVGLAAQRSLGNLLSGLHIAFSQPIRVDDVVVVEGEFGNVEEITLSFVVIRIWDKRRLILPLTYFLENPFENWTHTSAELLSTVFIFTDYTVPVQAVRDELKRLLGAHRAWNRKVGTLIVSEARESVVQLRALFSADNSSDASDLQSYIREGLITFVQQQYPEALPRTRVALGEQPGTPVGAGV